MHQSYSDSASASGVMWRVYLKKRVEGQDLHKSRPREIAFFSIPKKLATQNLPMLNKMNAICSRYIWVYYDRTTSCPACRSYISTSDAKKSASVLLRLPKYIDSSDVGEYKQPYHNSRIPATYCMRHFLQHIGWVANHLLEGQRRLFLEVEVCVTQDAFFFVCTFTWHLMLMRHSIKINVEQEAT